MKLVRMRLSNFRCFGPDPTQITLDDTTFVIGPNGSGKTAVLQALARMFSIDPAQRKIRASDFYIAASEAPEDAPAERTLWIEADFEFPELTVNGVPDLLASVPASFAHMQMETDDDSVVIRFRLLAVLDQDGDIEETFTHVIKLDAFGVVEAESRVSKLERNAIQVHYLPARRNPADHISYATNAMLGRILRAANWTTERDTVSALTGQINDTLIGNAAIAEIGAEITQAWERLHKGRFYANPAVSFARRDRKSVV